MNLFPNKLIITLTLFSAKTLGTIIVNTTNKNPNIPKTRGIPIRDKNARAVPKFKPIVKKSINKPPKEYSTPATKPISDIKKA